MSVMHLHLLRFSSVSIVESVPCGAPPLPLNTSEPNVLILGDSISLGFGVSATDTGYGYGLNVAALLGGPYPQFYTPGRPSAGLAAVQHAGGFGANGGSSSHGVACIKHWLGTQRWDVTTLNFGLHDCNPGGNASQYAANLETILRATRAASSAVAFVTTTPFTSYKEYSMPCVIRFNAVAREVIARLNRERFVNASSAVKQPAHIATIDLYAAVETRCGANYSACPIQRAENLHFSTSAPLPSGQQFTAIVVARGIQRLLPASKITPPINASRDVRRRRWRSRVGGQCGLPPPAALDAHIPSLLIIGDSVSDTGSGYGPDVRRLLEERCGTLRYPENNGSLAQVFHSGGWSPSPGADEQASSSAHGVACIASWLGDVKWDAISFNFGIHDCWGPQFVNATRYAQNLRTIYEAAHAALARGGTIVYTTTTPIAANCSTNFPRGCYGVAPECVVQRNQIALDVLGKKNDVVINDVWSAVSDVCGVNFTTCSLQHEGDVHPSGPGKQFLAIELAATVAPLLRPTVVEK